MIKGTLIFRGVLMALFFISLPVDLLAEEDVDNYGRIDIIGAQDVVIDDRSYHFTNDTRYLTSNEGVTYRSSFHPGQDVYFKLNDDRVILELRGLNEVELKGKYSSRAGREVQDATDTPSFEAPSQEIILEDGVWKN